MTEFDQPESNGSALPLIMTEAEFDQLRKTVTDPAADRVLVLEKKGLSLWCRERATAESVPTDRDEAHAADSPSDRWLCLETLVLPTFDAQLRRGELAEIVQLAGLPVLAVDPDGSIVMRLAPSSFLSSLRGLKDLPDVNLGDELGIMTPTRVRRGDSAAVVTMADLPILIVQEDGRIGLNLNDETLQKIADQFPMPGGRPESPDAVPDFDAWGVRREGKMIYFTGHVWGETPREYMRFGSGEPWAASVSNVALRFLYGDELADTPVSVKPDYFAHIHCFNDGAGYEGLGGDPPAGVKASDIERVSAGFGAVAADSNLRARTRAKPLTGIRSEAVPGATLGELMEGQALRNLTEDVQQFRRALQPYGKRAFTETVTLLHGAADDSANYKRDLLALAHDLVMKTGARQINLFQPVGTALQHDPVSVFDTVEAFRERGDLPIVLVAPIYPALRRSGSLYQPTAESMTMLAELDGLAGANWLPPLAFYAERNGDLIHVDFEVMPKHHLIAPTFGLKYTSADGDDVAVIDASVVADPITLELTRLQIKLERVPVAPGKLTYAYGNLEPSFDLSGDRFCSGGDLRDDWSKPSVTGLTLYRYALAFEFNL